MHPALIALLLTAPGAERRVMISSLDADRGSAAVAQNATRAISSQVGRRPDLSVVAQGDADVRLTGGIRSIGSGYLAILLASDARTSQPQSGESCRSADENSLTACLLEAADRLLRSADPIPVGRAGGTIVVSTLDGFDIKEGVARNVTGLVRIELQKIGGLTVSADNGDWRVRGTIAHLGPTWLVHLELLDPDQAVAYRTAEVFDGPQVELIQATRVAIRRLVGAAGAQKSEVSVVAEVSGAQLSIDGAPAQPFTGRETHQLDPGKHRLQLTAEGHRPYTDDFYVLDGQSVTLRPSLSEIPEPWFEDWKVWTAFGAALVVTGTIIGVAVANRPDDALIEVQIR